MTTIKIVVSVLVVVPGGVTIVVGVGVEDVPAPIERLTMGPVEVGARDEEIELPPPTDNTTTGEAVVEAAVEAVVVVVEVGSPELILIAPRQSPRGDGALFWPL